jgi:hypothetical protein
MTLPAAWTHRPGRGAADLRPGICAGQADADVTVADSGYVAAHHLKVGSAVTIGGTRFTVTGIVRQAPASSPPQVYIPLARAQGV